MTPGKLFAILCVIGIGIVLVLRSASSNSGVQTSRSSALPDSDFSHTALSDSDLETLTIQMERTRCYGTCPAYTVTIHGNGAVEYLGKSYVKVTERRNKQIDAATVKALVAQLSEAKFVLIPDQYSEKRCDCRRCTDFPSATVEVHTSSISHRVEHYYGCACAPKALFDLESAIDKTVGSEQWTGDTSKSGPLGTTCFGS